MTKYRFGMSRREAQKRIRDDEFSWDDLRQLLLDVRPEVERLQRNPGKINPGLSLSTTHNIFMRGIAGHSGSPKDHNLEISAVNVLREFGTSNGSMPRSTQQVAVHHEPLIDAATVDDGELCRKCGLGRTVEEDCSVDGKYHKFSGERRRA